jgi:hypothetical protein
LYQFWPLELPSPYQVTTLVWDSRCAFGFPAFGASSPRRDCWWGPVSQIHSSALQQQHRALLRHPSRAFAPRKIERMSRHNLLIFCSCRTEKSPMARNSHHRAIFMSKFAAPAGRRPELTPRPSSRPLPPPPPPVAADGEDAASLCSWPGINWAAELTCFDGFLDQLNRNFS